MFFYLFLNWIGLWNVDFYGVGNFFLNLYLKWNPNRHLDWHLYFIGNGYFFLYLNFVGAWNFYGHQFLVRHFFLYKSWHMDDFFNRFFHNFLNWIRDGYFNLKMRRFDELYVFCAVEPHILHLLDKALVY